MNYIVSFGIGWIIGVCIAYAIYIFACLVSRKGRQ